LSKSATTSFFGGAIGSTTVRYVHTDFYPYGGIRIDSKTNYGGEKRKYAGTEYGSLSGLNYAMARADSSSLRPPRCSSGTHRSKT
jgi:hypothetical protein